MNTVEVAQLSLALAPLVGRSVRQVWQPDRDTLVLDLAGALVEIDVGAYPCVLLPEERPHQPRAPFSFQGACRAHLGGRLLDIVAGPDARLHFCFAHGGLVAVLGGHSRGVWLADTMVSLHGPRALPPESDADGRPSRWPGDVPITAWLAAQRAEDRRRRAATETERKQRVETARLQRLERALTRDLAAAEQHAELRRRADALSTVLHLVPAGASRAEALDPDGGSEVIVLALDPKQPATRQFEAWSRRAASLRRAVPKLIARLADLRACLASAGTRAPVSAAQDSDAPPRSWAGPGGWRLRVGRNKAGNHELLRRAPKGSLWLHLRDEPSAHGLLAGTTGKSAPREVIAAAATLFAGATGAIHDAVDVMVARVEDVRPTKGQPGLVRVTRSQTLRVRGSRTAAGWTQGSEPGSRP
jgi:predicted ribosome quality control (RQC) complex YloA/Tae2 family protein